MMENTEKRKVMLSGIKPSGQLTLGNYIGALRNFVKYQDEYEMLVFIANLHCITVYQDPKELKKNLKDAVALYLACGISLLVWPAQSGLVICYVFGGISLLYGAVQIIRYCCNAAVSIFRYELVTGILCCAFGLFVILRADMVLAVLPFVFAAPSCLTAS